ncbi:MAG: helix-turn-helix transcriptional regulator [Pirellulales bacterium]|nr:helix-turn-helix transcriptional regulator [Pirellulales bacterium]
MNCSQPALGEALRKLRKARGLTLADVSMVSGFTQAYLSQIENGKKSPPLDTIDMICGVLQIPAPLFLFLASSDKSSDDSPAVYDDLVAAVKRLILANARFENDVISGNCGSEERPAWPSRQ